MNDKTKTWRSSTTTRSWSSTTDLTPEQRANIEGLLGGKAGSVSSSEKWSYAGFEDGEAFKVEINDGAVTVNGRHYDSLDAVPRAQRERIESLRDGAGMAGLWDMLKNAGVDAQDLAAGLADRKNKPAFSIETLDDADGAGPAAAAQPIRPANAHPQPALPPGAVPAGRGLRRTLLIGIAIGLALWVAQALNLF